MTGNGGTGAAIPRTRQDVLRKHPRRRAQAGVEVEVVRARESQRSVGGRLKPLQGDEPTKVGCESDPIHCLMRSVSPRRPSSRLIVTSNNGMDQRRAKHKPLTPVKSMGQL